MSATPPQRQIAVPTGTVTFAFTDIEGSTQRWDANRAAMQDAVRRHDIAMRSAIEAHGGYVFKTIGDAFCSAFARPEDAVTAMHAAQTALGAEDFGATDGLRVRAAVHTGTADERDGDYFGPAVNRVARLLAIGYGGQVLVSGVTADLVQGVLTDRATLHDLGQHRLKDLTYPEQVYQLLAPDLQREFPPLRSLEFHANNLPRHVSPLIGRDREVEEIANLLTSSPVVTLVGSGGVGKTRVSLQVAANLVDGSFEGVWFVEFAPVSDPELIPLTIASAAGMTLSDRQAPIAALIELLRNRRMLFVLDNCEHLVAGVAAAVGAIVRSCPTIVLLASSREGLGIDGEAVYRMPSLAVPPDVGGIAHATAIAGFGAVELFVAKAKSVVREFALSDANADAITQIVRRLDGIPLAIELAATRLNVLSAEALLDRLDDRLRILTGGDRTRMPRQQTLRALIDWSYDLLTERERVVFRRLGIFVGDWTLETATALLADQESDIEEWELLDILGSLVAKSLVVAELEEGHTARYRFLESTRAYAKDRLKQFDEWRRAANRHAVVFAEALEKFEQRHLRATDDRLTEELVPELDNLRAALAWCFGDDGDLATGIRIAAASNEVWQFVGSSLEGIRAIETALMRGAFDEPEAIIVRARLDLGAAHLLNLVRRSHRAEEHGLRALDFFRRCDDRPRTCLALRYVGAALLYKERREEARSLLAEAASIARAEGMKGALAWTLLRQAQLELVERRYVAAREKTEDALAILRSSHRNRAELIVLSQLCEISYAGGEVAETLANAERVYAVYRHKPNAEFATFLMNLTAYRLGANLLAAARDTAAEALDLLNTFPQSSYILLEHIALLAAIDGDHARAARLFGYSDTQRAITDAPREPTEHIGFERLMSILLTLEADERERLVAQGAAFDHETAFALASAFLASRR